MTQPINDIILDEDDVNPAPAAKDLPVLDDSGELTAAAEALTPPPWTVNPDGTRTLPLKVPVALKYKARDGSGIKTKEIAELRFRRLVGGDMIAIQNTGGSDAAATYEAFRRFTGEPPIVFDELDQDDVANVQWLIEDFFPKPRRGGKAT